MSFVNATPFRALDVPTTDARGREVVIVLVKATFEIAPDGRVVRAEQPAPIRAGDVPWDLQDPKSSLRFPNDVTPEKRGADLVVVGDAVSKAPVPFLDLAVKAKGRTAALRVHGERVFYQGAGAVQIGPAAPFERKRVCYERAYGGSTDDGAVIEGRNPIGVGVAKARADLVGKPAPQIEHPSLPHQNAGDKHPPVGFGAIPSYWSPRRELAGTFDAAWEATRMPLLPMDFDARHFNVAHPSLIFDDAFARGDAIAVLGMTLSGLFSFTVPPFEVTATSRHDRSGTATQRLAIDTILVQPERARFELLARKSFPIGRGQDVLRELRVDIDDA